MKSKNDNPADSNFPPKLSQPALRALHGQGYSQLEHLVGVKLSDIKKLHGIGPTAIEKLRQAMADNGLSFADED